MIAKSKPQVYRLPLTKARVSLGRIAKRAHINKEYFILEKDGVPIAGILDFDELEDYLELQDPKAWRAIQESNADLAAGRTKPAESLLQRARQRRANHR